MPRRANHSTQLDDEPKHEKPPEPAAQTGKNPSDARDNDGKLHKNQAELGVGDDHKTKDMEEGGRGTFP
jgi:hypothetical protein